MVRLEACGRRSEMKARTAGQERRSAVVWFVVGVIFLVAMFGMWWLVEETNEEGTHDAELLPFFALIPLMIGAYHLARSRWHHG
jgi:apolipoprotein N-acyltransferase